MINGVTASVHGPISSIRGEPNWRINRTAKGKKQKRPPIRSGEKSKAFFFSLWRFFWGAVCCFTIRRISSFGMSPVRWERLVISSALWAPMLPAAHSFCSAFPLSGWCSSPVDGPPDLPGTSPLLSDQEYPCHRRPACFFFSPPESAIAECRKLQGGRVDRRRTCGDPSGRMG